MQIAYIAQIYVTGKAKQGLKMINSVQKGVFLIAEHSCIVSEVLVEELFGNIDIIGEKIDLDGNKYSIIDVVKNQNFVTLRTGTNFRIPPVFPLSVSYILQVFNTFGNSCPFGGYIPAFNVKDRHPQMIALVLAYPQGFDSLSTV